MKNHILFAIATTLFTTNGYAQFFPIDTLKLNTSYKELQDEPNAIKRQKAFFDSFPNDWNEFIMTYQYLPKENYDLTMYNNAPKHIEALGEKTALIEDFTFCRKIVNVAIGGEMGADAPNYYKALLHKAMKARMNGLFHAVSQLRKGHQMQFWQFYWSNPVRSKELEAAYKELSEWISERYPEETKTMKIAFEYFYDGVNIDGGYLKD